MRELIVRDWNANIFLSSPCQFYYLLFFCVDVRLEELYVIVGRTSTNVFLMSETTRFSSKLFSTSPILFLVISYKQLFLYFQA